MNVASTRLLCILPGVLDGFCTKVMSRTRGIDCFGNFFFQRSSICIFVEARNFLSVFGIISCR